MKWIVIALIGVLAISLLRIITQVRRATRRQDDDWDARFIHQLRKAGVSPFDTHPVDFFFALPTAEACAAVTAQLEPEGYVVDSREEPEGGFSLHAGTQMRLIVPEMQALTVRFRQLAEANGGTYDGWAVAKAPKIPRAQLRS
jgi:hypothetical protein